MAELTAEQIAAQNYGISLNSVSKTIASSTTDWSADTVERDFTGNDIYFAHTTAEIAREALCTEVEKIDEELYFPGRPELKALVKEALELEASLEDGTEKTTLHAAIVEAKAVIKGDLLEDSADIDAKIEAIKTAIAAATPAEDSDDDTDEPAAGNSGSTSDQQPEGTPSTDEPTTDNTEGNPSADSDTDVPVQD